ncbi:tryptophan RNA-binding attenuation protein [Sporomusa rhizae]|uniref:tryptophan RNA-binding attenuation protein n=1 Tax=Sporomusa rhizae TaxID=357999 RepID=UPI00352A75C3
MKEQLNLEEPCGTCKGTGRLGTGSCPTCQGQGTVLNEAGKKLLHFLRNSIRTSEH